jgi:hypothetical protein
MIPHNFSDNNIPGQFLMVPRSVLKRDCCTRILRRSAGWKKTVERIPDLKPIVSALVSLYLISGMSLQTLFDTNIGYLYWTHVDSPQSQPQADHILKSHGGSDFCAAFLSRTEIAFIRSS